MELSHIGANRKEKRSTAFVDRKPEITFDEKAGNLSLLIRNADGLGTKGQYDYKVVLQSDDLEKIIREISENRAIFIDGPLRRMLESNAISLLRMLTAASTLPFQLAPTEREKTLLAFKAKLAEKSKSETPTSK